MTNYNMTGEEYDILYKRYLQRDPKELLEMAGMQEGYRVLDLCAGANGRATKAAIEMGASFVVPVDLNPCVKKLHKVKHTYVDPYCEDVGGFIGLSHLSPIDKFDIVICQQGINYWFNKDNMQKLGNVVKKGGVFIFNTFNKKPPAVPTVKEYEIDGLHYVEIVWMMNDMIKHVQVVEGHNSHATEFKWIEPEKFKSYLSPSFAKVDVKTINNTDIYVCRRNT